MSNSRPTVEIEESEPDYRFTLANERTMLAWLRTSLALIAGGVALETFAVTLQPTWLPQVVGLMAIAGGAVIALLGYFNWRRVQKAMRRGDPLPMQIAAPFATVGVVVVAVALAIGILL
ncbi:MAG: DUF202 domain-containing protein [Actinobacteria bacterium]|nr:DUF202 domain-containing protein [Actinomycetota bacterium]